MKMSIYPNKMICRGTLAGFVSWNGVESDVLKSAIQKYIRRSIFDKALWSVYEYDLIHEMYDREVDRQSTIRSLSTNLIHRLLIISIEDVGIGNPLLPITVDSLVKRYKDIRYTNHAERRRCLHDLVYLMCHSKKTRELSHIRCVYQQRYAFNGIRYKDDTGEYHIYDIENQYGDGSSLDNFIREYDNASDHCFYWFFKASGVKSTLYPLLDYVIENTHQYKDIMSILRQWYKEYDFKENILFAIQIVLLGLRTVDTVDITPPSYDDTIHLENMNNIMISIDPYVYDKHTKIGRKNGMNLSIFATEGAYVDNEWVGTNQEYKKIYTDFRQYTFDELPTTSHSLCNAIYSSGTKKGQKCTNKGKIQGDDGKWYCGVHKPKIEKVYQLHSKITHHISNKQLDDLLSSNTPRGQLLTGSHKKQVLIPTIDIFDKFVIKGPWKTSDITRLNTIIFRMKVLKMFNIPFIQYKLVGTESGNHIYLFSNNISTIPSVHWKYTLTYDKMLYMNAYIVNRESMGILQLHNITEDLQRMYLFHDDYFIFKGLIMLALLRVGDVGFYNILVSNNKAYIADYEENTTRDTFSSIDNILAKKVEKYNTLFISGIKEHTDKIYSMIENIDTHIDTIGSLMQQHDIPIYDIHQEWNDIKEVLISYLE